MNLYALQRFNTAQCSLSALNRFGNAFPKLAFEVLVFPRTLTNKSFEPFLIDVHFLSDVSDGIGTSGAQQARWPLKSGQRPVCWLSRDIYLLDRVESLESITRS